MAAIRQSTVYDGHDLLGTNVDRDTWLTPRYIIEELGPFDFDPCPYVSNPQWVCERYATDGLREPWIGRVFMNPPFSQTMRWLALHADHGLGISLVPASVESRVWRAHVWTKAKAVLLLHGRTRFCNPDGSATTGRPLRSIALIAWSDADAVILRNSQLAGVCLDTWSQR
jgi:hypothetical protein